jgi:hypothetical protein
MLYYSTLTAAIKAMHAAHGAGDVRGTRIYSDGRIEVSAQRTSCAIETRKGRVHGFAGFGKATLRMYGRQRTVCVVGS